MIEFNKNPRGNKFPYSNVKPYDNHNTELYDYKELEKHSEQRLDDILENYILNTGEALKYN